MNKVYAKVGESGSAFGKESIMLSMGYIEMSEASPSSDHVAQEDGTWIVTPEVLEANYQSDLATLDPLLAHVLRHDFNNEVEAKARAELRYEIAQEEVLEKYGKGSTVFITENGSCYHSDSECSYIGVDSNNIEINLSDGLKNYSPCSYCVNM